MAGKKDIVEQALKLVAGAGEQSAPKLSQANLEDFIKTHFPDASPNYSASNTDKYGPSSSIYYYIPSENGNKTIRLSDHDLGAREGVDLRYGEDLDMAKYKILKNFGVLSDEDLLKMFPKQIENEKINQLNSWQQMFDEHVNWVNNTKKKSERQTLIDEYLKTHPKPTFNSGGSVREGYQTKGRVVGDVVEQALKLVTGEEAIPRIKLRGKSQRNEPDWDAIISDIEAQTDPHPFARNERIYNDRSTFDISPFGETLHLGDIRALKPNQGSGTELIEFLKGIADKHDVPITGVAKVYHSSPGYISDTERLADWYRKRGFEVGEGYPEDGYEIRYNPRVAKGGGGIIDDVVKLAGKVISGEGEDAAQAGIRAYHGSPHDYPAERLVRFPTGKEEYIVGQPNVLPDLPQGAEVIQDFPLGRMRMDKIGTGEGAQAYGHGLYFAENEGVAKGYGDRLAGGPMGQHIYDDLLKITGNHGIATDSSLIDTIKRGGDLRQNLIELSKRKARSANDYDRETASFYANLAADEDFMKAVNDKKYNHMYEVNIAADPNTFLDWDKPLSEQPEAVRKGLEAAGFSPPPGGELMTGAQVYSRAMQNDPGAWGSTKEYVRAAMNELGGIPGIKYLDAGSRGKGVAQVQVMYKGKPHGDPIPVHAWNQIDQLTKDYKAKGYDVEVQDLGTRNYVVFDDKLISIIRKYGIAGASAMLGYNLMENLDANQARAATAADMDYQSQKQAKANGGPVREGYQTKGRVVKEIVEDAASLAKRILSSEPEVRTITGADLLKKTEGLSDDPFKFSKFSKPLSEMEYTVKMLPREEYKTIDPYDLVKENATIVGHISDRTAAGRELTNVGGIDLTEPLVQRGGVDFQRTTPYAWANRPGAAQTLYQKVNEPAGYAWDKKAKQFVKTGEQEGPVYTTPIFMGAPSANSSHMVGVPFVRMVPNMQISKADKLAFDAAMSQKFPGWPGINNTEAVEQFLYHGKLPKEAPTQFTKKAAGKKWRLGAGFPDVEEIMFSAMDPRLVGVKQGTTGMGFKEIDPAKEIIVKGENYHPDYPAAIPGKEYAGGFKYQVPQGIMFPEWWEKLKPELRLPKNVTGAQYAAMTQIPTQKATPEWADKVLKYWEENPIPWGYAAGGEVDDDDDVNDALRIAKGGGGAFTKAVKALLGEAEGTGLSALTKPGSGYLSVEGKPSIVKIPGIGEVEAKPIPQIDAAAEEYMRKHGTSGSHRIESFPPLDEELATRIAEEYGSMKHAPKDPEVKRAFDALAQETLDQLEAAKKAGIDLTFIKGEDPYKASPSLGYADLSERGHMYVFPTEQGFGSDIAFDPVNNPMLKRIGKLGNIDDATVNDAFRIVHDLFGHHGPGNPFFRAPGEERAFKLHSRMYSPEALPAMASETRGQNSWLNYGPYGRYNRKADAQKTLYADQKTGLMPPWTYEKSRGGEVDDDINDALRITKDVGGGTPVMMEDAKGNKYDAQGNVIPQDNTGPNPQRTEAAPQQNVMFNTAPQNYSQDVQPFIDYAVTPIDRPGMPSEPDLVNVMRIATQVAAQGQPTDDRGQGNFARRRSETVRSLVGASPEGYQSDYKGPFTYNAGDTADFLNTLIDFSPYGALEYAHDVPYEAGRTGDYGTAAVEGGLGALMTTPGMALAGRGIKKGYELAKQFPKLTAGAIGAGAATTGSDEAEAGPARWFSKAVEVARAIPMNKMTGEQALAMLRKGTSPEELRWMGAEDFLSGQKSVSKDDLVAFLEKNRVQPTEITLGGNKPFRRDDVVPSESAIASMKNRWDELTAKNREINDQIMLPPSERRAPGYQLAEELIAITDEMDTLHAKMIDDTIAEMGGLGLPVRYGPGSSYGEKYVTPGGADYRETLITLPTSEYGKLYQSGHWQDVPNVVGHIRTQVLDVTPPGANRPYKAFNVDEAQSDYAKAGREKGFGISKEEYEKVEMKAIISRERLLQHYEQLPDRHRPTNEEIQSDISRMISGRPPVFINPEGPAKPLVDAFMNDYKTLERAANAIPTAPYVTSTQNWTDLSIKKALDQAMDAGADYFTFTPGEAQAARYDLSKHINTLSYNPNTGGLGAWDASGKRVIDESILDDSELDDYVGKELAEKLRSQVNELPVDEDTLKRKGYAKLSGLDLKVGGEGMIDYYDNIYKKRVEKVVKDATGKKVQWEVIPVQTADGPREQLGIRLTDDIKNARFSDFKKGGRVTGGNTYGNDNSVAHALALTSEY